MSVVTSFEVQGTIATNTTVARPNTLRSSLRGEQGGLSGRPLAERSTEVVRYIYQHTEGKLPIIGVGGVFTHHDVIAKMMAGASLVQTYTGFVYEGPMMSQRVNRGLIEFMEEHRLKSITELVGQGTRTGR